MSKLDRLKAEISFHEKMFFTAIAMILGLLGWAANNYLTVSAVVPFFINDWLNRCRRIWCLEL